MTTLAYSLWFETMVECFNDLVKLPLICFGMFWLVVDISVVSLWFWAD